MSTFLKYYLEMIRKNPNSILEKTFWMKLIGLPPNDISALK